MTMIDLRKYHTAGVRVFSGRTKGTKVRSEENLDRLDDNDDEAQVIIPDEIISLNPSFFLGLFAISIRKLGRERFVKKYHFNADSAVYRQDIEDGITRAIAEKLATPQI